MRLIADQDTLLATGQRYDAVSMSGAQEDSAMNALATSVDVFTRGWVLGNGIWDREIHALATNWCFRALVALGVVEREAADSDIPCESWYYAARAGLTVADILAYGTRCGTIGCRRPVTTVITHGPADMRSADTVCDECRDGYLRRPALRTAVTATVATETVEKDVTRHYAETPTASGQSRSTCGYCAARRFPTVYGLFPVHQSNGRRCPGSRLPTTN